MLYFDGWRDICSILKVKHVLKKHRVILHGVV
jgi:hypothetical protein